MLAFKIFFLYTNLEKRNMKPIENLIEIEGLLENLLKRNHKGGILRIKVLYFCYLYQNLSVSMIIDKLGIKKTNFALMSRELEDEGCITIKKSYMDRRCRMIEVTEKGMTEIESFIKKLDSNIGATSIEVDNAIETICKFLNRII